MSPLIWCKDWEPLPHLLQRKINFSNSRSPKIRVEAKGM